MTIKRVQLDQNGNVIIKSPSPKLPADLPKRTSPRIVMVTLEPKAPRVNRKQLGENGHWQFPDKLGVGHFGFIYLIHDCVNDRMYIGKKQFVGAGKLNKGTETDWKWYASSSKELKEVTKSIGKESFEFYVLEQYRMRGSLGYAETWSLMYVEALANRDKWYNGLVNKVSWKVSEKITDRHKFRLNEIISGRGNLLEKYEWNQSC